MDPLPTPLTQLQILTEMEKTLVPMMATMLRNGVMGEEAVPGRGMRGVRGWGCAEELGGGVLEVGEWRS